MTASGSTSYACGARYNLQFNIDDRARAIHSFFGSFWFSSAHLIVVRIAAGSSAALAGHSSTSSKPLGRPIGPSFPGAPWLVMVP